MSSWTLKPFIYEINTAVWLNSLSHQHQESITLSNVPDEALDELASLNVDVIWLMGVWHRSPAVRQSALNYLHEYRPVLPDLTPDDVIGSAYAIGAYAVDDRLGGREGLATIRQRLQDRGLKLILDYVPNHVAIDHAWVTQHPDYMVTGTEETLKKHPGLFFKSTNDEGETFITAHGRDPHFPSWIDTAQVNPFSPDYRRAALDTLLDIASQCDGVRCDMAMLVTNDIFQQTWGNYVENEPPEVDFWETIIPVVKEQYPEFLFAAEVYWNMEYDLLQQEFDLAYDKTLFDRLQQGDPGLIRDHLIADGAYQQQMIRFIENHDEPRAAASLGIEKGRAAATIICTLPGAALLHDGQFTGRQIKLPVQITRQPHEPPNHALEAFYRRLLEETNGSIYEQGNWRQFQTTSPYKDIDTHNNLLTYGWEHANDFRLVVVNITPRWSQATIHLDGWDSLQGDDWRLYDVLGSFCTYAQGEKLVNDGLYVEMEAFQSKILHFQRLEPHQEMEQLFQSSIAPV